MRKEVLLAIGAGILFGIVLAFGIWRVNSALKSDTEKKDDTQAQASPAPSQKELGIAVANPDDFDVITESPYTLSGITKAQSWVSISTLEDDYFVQSDEKGEFEKDIDLTGGVNQISITAFDDAGNSVTETRLIVFSTEFLK